MIASLIVKMASAGLVKVLVKNIVLLLLKELVESTENDLDDKIVKEVEKALETF